MLESVIQQERTYMKDDFISFNGVFKHLETYKNTNCPKTQNDPSPNPYYVPKKENTPNGAKEFQTLLGDPVKRSSNAGIDLANPPTGPSGSGQAVPLIADNSDNTPVISLISDSGNLLETPFSPVDPSAFKPVGERK